MMSLIRTLLGGTWAYLAAAGVVVVVVAGIYAKGRIDASHAAEVSKIKQERSEALKRLELIQDAYKEDSLRYQNSLLKIQTLQSKVDGLNDYIESSESGSTVCIDPAGTDRLRNLWE
jgi:hypothetical protein